MSRCPVFFIPLQFCLLVCSLCTFFAVLGRYIPGIVISYILGESAEILQIDDHQFVVSGFMEVRQLHVRCRYPYSVVWKHGTFSSCYVNQCVSPVCRCVCEVLGVFLWPLVSSHDVSLWLEPVLQKLDFGIGEFFQKIKEDRGKKYIYIIFF